MAALWLLNLAAELELDGDAPSRTARAAQARFRPLARALLDEGDLECSGAPREGDGRTARAWCATPRAHAVLAAAGADTSPLCPGEVVRGVLGRGFAAPLRDDGERGAFVRDARALSALLDAAPRGEAWLAKREHSLAGGGRRRLRAGALQAGDEAWIAAALACGGLQVEPWFEIEREYALHGHLARDGTLAVGRPCRLVCDARGSWRASEPAAPDELAPREARALDAALRRGAAALRAAGYHGAFGVDAFRHARGFRALSELNARFSLGWAVGFGRVERLEAPAREVAP